MMNVGAEEVNSMDLVIGVYKKDIDQSLLDESLKRSVEERIRVLEEFQEFLEELRSGAKTSLDQIR